MRKILHPKMILLPCLLLLGMSTYCQSFFITEASGNSQNFQLVDIRRLDFQNNALNVRFKNGTTISWPFVDVRSFNYGSATVDIQKRLNHALLNEVTAFPNPAKDKISIRFQLRAKSDVEVSLYKADGRLVLQKSLDKLESGEHTIPFDLSHVSAELIYIRVATSEITVTQPLMIAK